MVYRGSAFGNASLSTMFMAWNILLIMVLRPDWLKLLTQDSRSRRKGTALLVLVLITAALGSLFAPQFSRYAFSAQLAFGGIRKEGEEPRMIGYQSGSRFVDRVDLTSIEQKRLASPDELVFRVEASQPPGYMRTLSFEQFNGSEWSNPWSTNRRLGELTNKRLAPEARRPNRLSGLDIPSSYVLFAFPLRDGGTLVRQEVIVPEGTGRLVPLPLNCAFIAANQATRNKQLVLDAHGNVLPSSVSNDRYVVIAGSRTTWEIDETYLKRLQQPDQDQIYLRGFAEQIVSPDATTGEKVQAITDYFVRHFQYSLGSETSQIGRKRMEIRQFLDERRAAHCEYFSTASALLLRALGVPCRLSTGYLVYETDSDDDYYLAQNRHAHAWVEAYDESNERWLLVESTPGIQQFVNRFQPTVNDADENQTEGHALESEDQGIWGKFKRRVARIWHGFSLGRYGWLVSLGFATLLALALKMRNLNLARGMGNLSLAVRKKDRRAERFGFLRAPHETCLQFASRLDTGDQPEHRLLANWYRQHSRERYG